MRFQVSGNNNTHFLKPDTSHLKSENSNKKTPHHRATRYFRCKPLRECSNNADSAATDANEPNYVVFPAILTIFIIQTGQIAGQISNQLLYRNRPVVQVPSWHVDILLAADGFLFSRLRRLSRRLGHDYWMPDDTFRALANFFRSFLYPTFHIPVGNFFHL